MIRAFIRSLARLTTAALRWSSRLRPGGRLASRPKPLDSPIATWRDAERFAAYWMVSNGFPDARVTANGADGGVDVTSRTGLAQVKFHGKPVGRPDIQRLVGARGHEVHRELLFFSSNGYTSGAIEYAATMGVRLLHFETNGRVTQVGRGRLHRAPNFRAQSQPREPIRVWHPVSERRKD